VCVVVFVRRCSSSHGVFATELSTILNQKKCRYAAAETRECAAFRMDQEQWLEVADVEAVLHVVKQYTTLVQTEKRPMAGFSRLIREGLLRNLRADTISVIDINAVTKAPAVPRVARPVANLTAVGATCRLRAQLEAERRFCGNAGVLLTEINGNDARFEKWQTLPALLDPRTLVSCGAFRCSHFLVAPLGYYFLASVLARYYSCMRARIVSAHCQHARTLTRTNGRAHANTQTHNTHTHARTRTHTHTHHRSLA
jgi:hypothetical protein